MNGGAQHPFGGVAAEEKGEETPPRVYEVWKGNNVFLLQGRLIFGPDVRSLFLTLLMIIGPVSIFCAFVAKHLMDNFSRKVGLSIMVSAIALTLYDLSLLLLTCARDPGIIPRNLHPPEPESHDGLTEVGVGQTQLRLPRTRDVIVNNTTVRVKYCDTCMLYRPPRCSHCSICNNCVENFDHHCPWVGQCIGLRNYRFFFMFIVTTTLLCAFVFSCCWVCIKIIMVMEQKTFWKAAMKTPASIILIIYSLAPIFLVAGLSFFHTYLISTNQTTYENFRYQYDRRANPYNRGVVENFKEKFFTSIPHSKNRFRERVHHEQCFPVRTTDGGFISPNMGRTGEEIEMGRKATWSEAGTGLTMDDLEVGIGSGRLESKEGGSGDASRI